MRICIISLPLHTNYGGVIQAFVLQNVMKEFGHTVDVVTKVPFLKKSFFPKQALRYVKRYVLKFLGRSSVPVFLERDYNDACARLYVFVSQKIDCKIVSSLHDLKESDYDVLVFGSDQIWRPQYAKYGWGKVEDVFGGFAKNWNAKKIAYAASFGVDKWEFSKEETLCCADLIKNFDAVSVRELSGVQLCKKYLSFDAQFVLDPTLLWKKERYYDICKDIPQREEKILIAYVLNSSDSIRKNCEKIAKERGLVVRMFSSDANATLTVPEWLAMFRDASFIVTDSFHGTVFSIIFEKEFKCFYNKDRGASRFESLLDLHKSGKIDEMRQFSLNWLKKTLDFKLNKVV